MREELLNFCISYSHIFTSHYMSIYRLYKAEGEAQKRRNLVKEEEKRRVVCVKKGGGSSHLLQQWKLHALILAPHACAHASLCFLT